MLNKELHSFKNLAVYLIQGEDRLSRTYATLEEAMNKGLIVLHETGNVNELSVDNLSDSYVFIMSGDIVKGGRQDRTIAEDVILKPGSKNAPLKSFCVEQSRWHRRENESDACFSTSTKMTGCKSLKMAVRERQDQRLVWEEVENYGAGASRSVDTEVRSRISSSSLELTMDNKQLKSAVKDYVDAIRPAFEGKPDVLGFAFCINGKFSTVEEFGSAELFGKLRNKLLNSAASEALLNYKPELPFTQPAAEDVERFIAQAGQGELRVKNTGTVTIEKSFRTAGSILYESFHAENGTEEKNHSVAYSVEIADTKAKWK
jgi:hypothetical protein